MDTPHAAQRPDTPRTGPRRPLASIVFTLLIFAAAGLLLMRMVLGGGTAPTPEFLPVTTDLASMTFQEGTPIVAVVTADWCGPCQKLKRTTLTDDRVRALLSNRSQPVMIDGTDADAAMPTLQRLGVRAFPSTVVIRGGHPVATLEGYASADKYLAWLEEQL